MEQKIIDLLLEIMAKNYKVDNSELLLSIAPSIVAIIVVVFGYIQARNILVLQKENDNKADNRKLLIQKSDEIIHDLFTLDDTLQCMFQEVSYLVTQTEETDELNKILDKREEGKEKYRMQYIKCKSGINTYYKCFKNTFSHYEDEQVKIMCDVLNSLNGKYNEDERIALANSIQQKSRYLSEKLNEIIAAIIDENQKYFIDIKMKSRK